MASEQWHPGVIGIVASRVVERYSRPTVLIALQGGEGKGSGRSIPAFHLYNALASASENLLKFGGHQQAAGLTLAQDKLDLFYDAFDSYAASVLSPSDLIPEVGIDAEIDESGLDDTILSELDKLRPYGMGNPEPVFLMRRVEVIESRVLKGEHLKLRLRSGNRLLDAIGFNMATVDTASGLVDILFTADRNEWNGRVALQLKIKDIRKSNES